MFHYSELHFLVNVRRSLPALKTLTLGLTINGWGGPNAQCSPLFSRSFRFQPAKPRSTDDVMLKFCHCLKHELCPIFGGLEGFEIVLSARVMGEEARAKLERLEGHMKSVWEGAKVRVDERGCSSIQALGKGRCVFMMS